MAGRKDKERFIFFKYVPPKKGARPLKDQEASKAVEADTVNPEGFGPPHFGMPGEPDFPMCPEEPECPDMPDSPECPELPEIPEVPEYPECPEEPEAPECPEIPVPPECPELPEFPEIPEIPEIPELPELPEKPAEGPCPENAVMHVIQAGDTFWKLAKRYGTTMEAIEAANPDIDPLNLQVGATICVPTGIPGAKG